MSQASSRQFQVQAVQHITLYCSLSIGYVLDPKPVSVRPVQTRGKKPKVLLSWFTDSSVASSGDEYRPEAVTRRVKKAGNANLVIKRALSHFGLVKQEKILDKARQRRGQVNPLISFDQEETEFINCDRHSVSSTSSGNCTI